MLLYDQQLKLYKEKKNSDVQLKKNQKNNHLMVKKKEWSRNRHNTQYLKKCLMIVA